MTSWLFLAACVLVPQLWALLLASLYRRRDARGSPRRTPDYQI